MRTACHRQASVSKARKGAITVCCAGKVGARCLPQMSPISRKGKESMEESGREMDSNETQVKAVNIVIKRSPQGNGKCGQTVMYVRM